MTKFQTFCALMMGVSLAGVVLCLVFWWLAGVAACIVVGYLALFGGIAGEEA